MPPPLLFVPPLEVLPPMHSKRPPPGFADHELDVVDEPAAGPVEEG
jgi:hypothetical protein